LAIPTATCAEAELISIPAQDVERADRTRLVHERNDELGSHTRHDLDVSRIRRHIIDDQRLLAGDGGPDEALGERQPLRSFGFRVADGVRRLQLTALIVEQVDRKHFERDETGDQPWDLMEKLVEIEDGRDLAAQIEQRRDDFLFGRG
jgi:hypothetical protein